MINGEQKLRVLVLLINKFLVHEPKSKHSSKCDDNSKPHKNKGKKAGKPPKMLHRITQSSHGFPIPTLHKHKTKTIYYICVGQPALIDFCSICHTLNYSTPIFMNLLLSKVIS